MNTQTQEREYNFNEIKAITEIKIKMEERAQKTLGEKIEMVKDLVLGYYSQTWEQINVEDRKRELVKSRHLITYFMRKKVNLGLCEIGRMFTPSKDHSTITHSIRTVKNWRDTDATFRNEFEQLERYINFELK